MYPREGKPQFKASSQHRFLSTGRIELSWCQDWRALLHTVSKLSIHKIVENLNRELEAIESVNAYIGTIDENGSIEIEISEEHGDILQAFTIRANRKRLRTLKKVEDLVKRSISLPLLCVLQSFYCRRCCFFTAKAHTTTPTISKTHKHTHTSEDGGEDLLSRKGKLVQWKNSNSFCYFQILTVCTVQQ